MSHRRADRPCQFPALTINAALPGSSKSIKMAVKGHQVVLPLLEREGWKTLSGKARLQVPAQRA
ncbi:MAG: hypothetical protein OXJ64_20365 [Boseongicola sp.]|nr:hypothetical protein [Boseongicola sp.]